MPFERWYYIVRLRLRSLFRRAQIERELDEEFQFHSGLTAHVIARSKEECRDVGGINILDDFVRDLALAIRILRKSPVFACAATATIALGIGAATAMFSVTNAVLLRSLPYRDAERLVVVESPVFNTEYVDLHSRTQSVFADAASVFVYRAIVPREDGSAEKISKGQITANFFRMLGASIAFGRDFTAADAIPPAHPEPLFPPPDGSVAILSHGYFVRRYGANPAILDHEMRSSGQRGPLVVGVLAPGFELLLPGSPEPSPDVWIVNNRAYDATHRMSDYAYRVVALLGRGVTLNRAQAQSDAAANDLRKDYPGFRIHLVNWRKALTAEVRPAIEALMGAVMFLLLIACANVANLLLVRTSQRERELAVRAALGAGRGRLMRQMLAEAILLAAGGTAAGIGLAHLGLRVVIRLLPANVPRVDSIEIDWRVVLFSCAAGLIEAIVFGAIPAWKAARADVMRTLRGDGRGVILAKGGLLRSSVIVGEVALSFVLLTGAGLMFRSFLELRRVNPGFDPHGLLTVLAIGDAHGFQQSERRLAFLREVQDRLRSIPGVQAVSGAPSLPLGGAGGPHLGVSWSTDLAPTSDPQRADMRYVLPGYFEILRTRLIEGRTFTESDNAPDHKVAVLDDLMAAKAFPNQSAIGKRILVSPGAPISLSVIGVVAHQRLASLAEPGLEEIFVTDGFWGIGISRQWALRTQGDPTKIAPAVRAAIAKVSGGRLAVTELQTMEAIVDAAEARTRFHLLLIGFFAATAALLAAVGLYGVLATSVRQRTAEIGVRIAVGAEPSRIFRLVLGQGVLLSAIGIAIGEIAALGLTRLMGTMLVGVKPADPSTFAVMAVLFAAIATIASWIPAHRAASIDPTAALREG
jgi:putative ABC transport system permease protein